MRFPPRDVLPAAVLLLTGQYEVWVGPLFGDLDGPRAANGAMVALFCVPLLWRRRRPVAVFALVLAAATLHVKVEHGVWLVPADEGLLQAWFAVLIASYSVAAHAPRQAAVRAGLAGGAAFVANDVPMLLEGVTTADHTVPAWFILAGAWGLGYALRERRLEVRALAERNVELAHEREAAAAAERARIARELHDVVAHSLSVMVVQAQAADRVLEGEQASAREALQSIDSTGRSALGEMRRLVGMLREAGEPGLTPQPGLAQLDVLLAQMRDAGLPVELEIEGEARQLSPGLDLAAYRIVQEALTNVLKHAGPARARVAVRFQPADMQLEVADDGAGAGHGPLGGHGLVGMRERVAVYGGTLETGSVNGRGFRIRATLPT